MNTVPDAKIIRYSNVYGVDKESDNFLTSIIRDALTKGHITLFTTPDSAKDYISVADAASLTVDIALSGKERIYNVATGINISNEVILKRVSEITGCTLSYSPDAKKIEFPESIITGLPKSLVLSLHLIFLMIYV